MDEKKQEEDEKNGNDGNGSADPMADRLTGFQIFSEKSGVFNLDKLEAAAEELENGNGDDDVGDVDEDLFDDDEDLDDLDFDSDEEDDDEDDDSEPDI